MKRFIYTFVLLAAVVTLTSATKFKANDYESATKRITANATTPYEKAHAIYSFLANDMIYDVSGTINTADECWDKSTGMCKAYCDVYLILANHAGLKARVINGIAKNFQGASNESGHKWIAVETEKGEILCDPVCGSGTVKKGVFTKSDHDMSWWDVAPEAMIITHFPDNPADQKLKKPVTREQFNAMPSFEPNLLAFGLKPADVLNHFLKGGTLPELKQKASRFINFVDFPASNQLRVGKTYEIKYTNKIPTKLLLDPQLSVKWAINAQGNTNIITFTPLEACELTLVANPAAGEYEKVAVWEVAPATDKDLKNLQSVDPYLSSAWKKIDGLQTSRLKQHLLDPNELVNKIESGEVTSMPVLYTVEKTKIISMPLTSTLKAGKTYHFAIADPKDAEIIFVINDRFSTASSDWKKAKDGSYTRDFLVPIAKRVSIFEKCDDGQYQPVVDYDVEEPSADDKARLEEKDPLHSEAVLALDQAGVQNLVKHGFDSNELYKLAKSGKVTSLPTFYKGGNYDIVEIPLTEKLQVGKSYTFTIRPKSDKTKWAIINGKTQLHQDKWSKKGDKISIKVTPEEAGEFIIACLEDGNEKFDVVLVYMVE